MRTLRFLLRKEYLQIFRDRTMLFEIFMIPIVQLLILSNAATFTVRSAPTYVIDDDRSATSRGLVERFVASGRFTVTAFGSSMQAADEAMLDREANVIIRIPRDFERDIVRSRAGTMQLVLNAEDGAAAGVTASYAQRIIATYGADLQVALRPNISMLRSADEALPRPGVSRLDVRTRGWYNTELDYRDYMVPGILVLLVTVVGTMLTAVNIAREKEMGTLDQLNVTPVTRAQFILGKLIPFWTVGLMELAIGMLVARFVFSVPMEGSIPLVFAIGAIYLVAALGMGLWISTLVDTQQQAIFITFFIVIVYLLLSGLFTPVRSMPEWAQWIAYANPMMHFTHVMRAILLKGAGLSDVIGRVGILAAYAVGVLLLALRQYAKRTA